MKAKLQALLSGISKDLLDTWQRSKIILLAIVAAIVYLEFNRIKEALTVVTAKNEIKNTESKDKQLAQEEVDANQKADTLVKEAQNLSNQNSPVKEDWYKGSK